MNRLVALYPQAWRDRYEDEFLALLAERRPDPRDRLDIVRGAVDARLHPQVDGAPAVPEPPVDRGRWPAVAGWLTLVGGVLWIAALVVTVNSGFVVYDSTIYRDTAAAMPFFFGATMLLGVGLIGLALRLPESARVARGATYVGSLAGLLWALAPWFVWAGLVAFAGLVVVAVASWRTGRWSWWELGIFLASVGLCWGPILAVAFGLLASRGAEPDIQFLVLSPLAASWFVVGTSLVRAPRPQVAPPPPVV